MKLLSIILFFFSFMSGVIYGQEGYYSLSYKMNSVVAYVELNGIKQTESGKEGFLSGVSTGLNLWIMPGENTLKIKLTKPQKGKNQDNPQIKVAIRLGTAGQSTEEGKEIVSFEAPESEDSKIEFPLEKEVKFTPELIPPSSLWEKVEPTNLDSTSKKEITELVQALHKAANTANVKDFFKLIEFKMQDMSKAMYSNPEENKNDKALKEFLKTIKGKLKKLPPKLSFHPVANGKLIFVTDSNGNDPIQSKPSQDGEFNISVYVGKIDGKWTLVR
ncbi:MAG TPA: hypothetical protein PK079_04970 [Leptospiraceae bacterium]|nr:hypothetical protein [Leptospiraceae bacterium]HMW06222.1 hypothetical protein [Leptospiraceae bacterium]HMY31684.1 hypothetical protein [Leptospiraceae bacterium]HMZ67463.1 hypothetical protein [Leptospiraceae bacterium]HNA08936.1 hypothetical protein [Leptospiraceae bacterium]